MKTWKKIGIATLVTTLAAGAGFAWAQRIRDLPPASRGVKMPPLSSTAAAGQRAFDAACAKCHGAFGLGTDKGPPLLNTIYNPGHYSDGAFLSAVHNAFRQHHWKFGDLPEQPAVSDEELKLIVRYVREVQQANGIVYQEHQM